MDEPPGDEDEDQEGHGAVHEAALRARARFAFAVMRPGSVSEAMLRGSNRGVPEHRDDELRGELGRRGLESEAKLAFVSVPLAGTCAHCFVSISCLT